MRFNSILASIALAATTVLAPLAAHAELVTNGGFETGNFSGWTVDGNTTYTGVNAPSAASGTYGAFFGAVNSVTLLHQQISTVAGGAYTLSFDLANDGGTPNLFAVNFGGPDLLSLMNADGFGYTHFSYDFTGSGLMELNFWMQQNPAYWRLDNVSVVEAAGVGGAVPEPGTWAMLIAGFGMLGMAMRRRRTTAAAV